MTGLRVSDVAALLGVSDDTVRRLVAAGELLGTVTASGPRRIDARSVAEYAHRKASTPQAGRTSARNRLPGIVTDVRIDGVMAQVELQCGPHRVVSLMSAEAAEDLGLVVGSLATAVVKATTVIVETP